MTSIYAINKMTTEELVNFVNDNIDTTMFPLGEIKLIEDEEAIGQVANDMGMFEFVKFLRDNPLPKNTKYFQYDQDTKFIYWYTSKKSIIDTIGEETLCDWYDCSFD